jgi:hypothetical protein
MEKKMNAWETTNALICCKGCVAKTRATVQHSLNQFNVSFDVFVKPTNLHLVKALFCRISKAGSKARLGSCCGGFEVATKSEAGPTDRAAGAMPYSV